MSASDFVTFGNSRGSEWRRWDPHLHAPGTLLSDQFGGDWETYLQSVEQSSPVVQALGVTDYFCIETYRNVREWKAKDRLPNVQLLFPNVEMRLDIKTAKKNPVNLHLLFSPDDPNHEAEITRILSHLIFEFRERKYRCSLEDFEKLGRDYDSKQKDKQGAIRAGANQFKTTLQDLRELFRTEAWLRNNCLIAVAGGSGDGTAGLKQDDSFAAMRREIEAFADIILAATPSQRDFWLGKKPDADRTFIEQTYRATKPCLHGSDAHRDEKVAAPDLDRYCWIKSDPIFEALRQAVIEPEDRVWIGPEPPAYSRPSIYLDSLRTSDTPWLQNDAIDLNPGMIAIIGARGSGKTALVDMISSGAHALGGSLGESSFLGRASYPVDYLGSAEVQLTWNDTSTSEASLNPRFSEESEDDLGEVCYLSQHFVSQLCSADGLATELRNEMERVVFDSSDSTDRYETSSFSELTDLLLEPIRHRREELRESIRSISDEIVREELLRDKLTHLRKERLALEKKIEQDRKELKSLLPKGSEIRATHLASLEQACANAEARVEKLRRRRKALDDLTDEIAHIRQHIEPNRLSTMRQRFAGAELSDDEWKAFGMSFIGNVDGVLYDAKQKTDVQIKLVSEGNPDSPIDVKKDPPDSWPVSKLREARDQLKKAVVVDANQERKYKLLQQAITTQETSLRRSEVDIKNAEGAAERRRQLIDSRRAAYASVFSTFVDEEQTLANLYAPLQRDLGGASGALSKLRFVVRRHVDLKAWVTAGEQLLDLRKTEFHGHGALRKEADQYLADPWRLGSAEEVASSMDEFRKHHHKSLLAGILPSVTVAERPNWIQSLAAWLYDTEHIDITYGIEYEGVAIEQLSPGTRGIVLLLLYLAIDRQDRKPLLIDQPEENLDPRSVFEELVPHFREARKRRQVIIVTHNANLVVNTDVDQVIVATSRRTEASGLPTISYLSGSLENKDIRSLVCSILEGGERAFLERERRYRLRWGEMLALQGGD
jgi:ABC-type lipoprotein export system ATPase subunit